MNPKTSRALSVCHSSCLGLRKALADRAGNASLELALVFSFIGAPMLLGTAGVAFLVYDSIEVSNAAHAGAAYGMMSSTFASHNAGIQSAAQAEAPDLGANLTVTPTVYWACSSAIAGTQYSSQAAANAVCPANASNHLLEFVQVSTSASVRSPVGLPGLSQAWTLKGASVMEVQE